MLILIYIYIRSTCEHILTLRFAALILTLGVGTSSKHCCTWLVWRWAKQRLAITTAHSSPFSSPWNHGGFLSHGPTPNHPKISRHFSTKSHGDLRILAF